MIEPVYENVLHYFMSNSTLRVFLMVKCRFIHGNIVYYYGAELTSQLAAMNSNDYQ